MNYKIFIFLLLFAQSATTLASVSGQCEESDEEKTILDYANDEDYDDVLECITQGDLETISRADLKELLESVSSHGWTKIAQAIISHITNKKILNINYIDSLVSSIENNHPATTKLLVQNKADVAGAIDQIIKTVSYLDVDEKNTIIEAIESGIRTNKKKLMWCDKHLKKDNIHLFEKLFTEIDLATFSNHKYYSIFYAIFKLFKNYQVTPEIAKTALLPKKANTQTNNQNKLSVKQKKVSATLKEALKCCKKNGLKKLGKKIVQNLEIIALRPKKLSSEIIQKIAYNSIVNKSSQFKKNNTNPIISRLVLLK